MMADRRERALLFDRPSGVTEIEIKRGIDEEEVGNLVAMQALPNGRLLIELDSALGAQKLLQHGFDAGDSHIMCKPSTGEWTNVSVLHLPTFIEDNHLTTILSTYGELKSEIIRLKYHKDHPLAGIENGNRLVRMHVMRTIPYSLKIEDHWCRIIYTNQKDICSNCMEEGHRRRTCPTIQCRKCRDYGHLSRDCPTTEQQQTTTPAAKTQEQLQTPTGSATDGQTQASSYSGPASVDFLTTPISPDFIPPTAENILHRSVLAASTSHESDDQNNETQDQMDTNDPSTSLKRRLPTTTDPTNTDTETDERRSRRSKLKPKPNIEAGRSTSKNQANRTTNKENNGH